MPMQKREKRSYIGLVSDEAVHPHAVKPQPNSSQPMRDYLRGLLAAMFERRGEMR